MKIRLVLSAIALVFLTTGCFGGMTGLVSGPVMGGTSLTAKMYDSSSIPPAGKAMATPFTFAAGTGVGVFPAVAKGLKKDSEQHWEANDMLEILDPFNAGLFRAE